MKNYRQFIDQKIDFSINGGKNIIIIEGKNGFGKSNIFNAITWCLFDIEEHLRSDARTLPICNSKLFQKINVQNSTQTSVKVVLETEQGIKEIERKVKTYKTEDGGIYRDKSEVKVTECIDKNWKISPYPEYIISRIIPKEMRHFFFIDGERLRQLFEDINPDVIKQSIFDLSQITLLQKAIDHLNSLKRKFRGSLHGKEPDLDLFEEKLEDLKKEIDEDKKRLNNYQENRENAKGNIKKLDRELEGIEYEDLQVLEEKRNNLENYLKELENQISERKFDYIRYLFDLSPKLLLKNPMENTLEIIAKLKIERKLPPQIEATFIRELLKDNRCICGTDLKKEENAPLRENLEKLLFEGAEYSEINDAAQNLKFSLNRILDEAKNFKNKSKEFELKIRKLEDNYNQKQKELKEVKTKIGNLDCERIKKIHGEREKYNHALSELNGKIGKLEENIKHTERQYRNVEKMYNTEIKKKDKLTTVAKKISTCELSIENLETIKNKLMNEIREEIQNDTKRYFDNLISVKNFSNFQIKENYDLRIEQDGFNAITSLSAAETLCLGYSFMTALRHNSKFLAPIIIDMPLAKIDKEYRINVAEWFEKSLSDAQVTLLVTNVEYTTEFRDAIRSSISKEYKITYDEEKEISEVIDYARL